MERIAAAISGITFPLLAALAVAVQLAIDVNMHRLESGTTVVWPVIATSGLLTFALSLLLQPATAFWFYAPSRSISRGILTHRYWVWTSVIALYLAFSHVVAVAEVLAHPTVLSVMSAQLWARSIFVVSTAITIGGLRPLKAG